MLKASCAPAVGFWKTRLLIETKSGREVLSEKIIFREKFEILSNSNRVVHIMILNQESVELKYFFNKL